MPTSQIPGDKPSFLAAQQLEKAFRSQDFTSARDFAQVYTRQHPQEAYGWKILGAALLRLDFFEEALEAMQRAVVLSPTDAGAHCNLGVILKRLDRLQEAEASYSRALLLSPKYAIAHNNLGLALAAQGRYEQAAASYEQAVKFMPDYADAHCNLGVTQMAQGFAANAAASFRQAIQLRPGFAQAHCNLGSTLHGLGEFEQAEATCRAALDIDPDLAPAHHNLGSLFLDLNRLADAAACFQRALRLDPNLCESLLCLGYILSEVGQPAESEAICRRALQINPASPAVHFTLGNTLMAVGRLPEAEACFRKALLINPDDAATFGSLLFLLNYHPDLGADEIFTAYRQFESRFAQPHYSKWRNITCLPSKQRRLKVGYVSPDFRQHSCGSFLEPLLEHHDKTQVEVFAYAEINKGDAATSRYKKYVDQWIPTKGMSDDALAARIRSDGIDVLVDLAGHTRNNRLLAFARKPAPVSVSWLGYGYTTGLRAIDYFLTDWQTTPAGSEPLFSEKPWRLDRPAYVYRAPTTMGAVNSLPLITNGFITFGTLTRAVRINHRTIRTWASLLKRVDNALLVIDNRNFATEAVSEPLIRQFEAQGIDRKRLRIGFHSSPWDVLRSIDIGLDCFPHNSGTTLFESLYMGVPFVTMAERPSVGRLGSSILQAVGHPEWIAHTEEDFVEIAVNLTANPQKLVLLRSSLRSHMENGPIMNEPDFARTVESGYRTMYELFQSSQ